VNALTRNSQWCQNAIVDFEKLANEHKDAVAVSSVAVTADEFVRNALDAARAAPPLLDAAADA